MPNIKNLLVCAFVMVLSFSQALAQNESLTIVTEDWPPYNYEEDGVAKGFSVEIVQSIMQELGVDYEILVLPGERGERMLNSGPNVLNFSIFRTAEREPKYKWIGPIATDGIFFYKKKGSPLNIQTLEDAKNVGSVGSPHKGLVFGVLQKQGFTNLDTISKTTNNIKKLVRGRIDLFVGETPLGIQYKAQSLGLKMSEVIEKTPVQLVEFPLYIACSKDTSDETVESWQQALDKLKQSGKYTEIYNKYLGSQAGSGN